MKKKYDAYISHCIRGAKGMDATHEDMERNCAATMIYVEQLRLANPGLKLYVPAEHEDFVQIAYEEHLLKEEQILHIDCCIIDSCTMVIAHNPECISRGMRVEIDYAKSKGIPVLYTKGCYCE